MANVDRPHGLQTLGRTLNGGCPQVLEFQKDANAGTAIFVNDVVQRETDGNIAAGGTPGTTRYQGVSLNHGAASTLTDHLVIVSPEAVFEAQDNAATDGITLDDMGALANFEFNAGSASSLLSGHELNETGINTTASLDARLIQLLKVPSNEFGPNARIEVVINKHIFNKEATGV